MDTEPTNASRLIGPNPRGAVARVSRAVRASVLDMREGGARAVLVGLSGGADSTALALAAIDAGTRAGLAVHTLTVDHGLRPGSDTEAEAVRAWAQDMGARATVCRVEVAREHGPEGAARQARRTALREEAARLGEAVPILLGHSLDDQAETVLLRLARGSGVATLRAMCPVTVDPDGTTWIRPLLGLRRADLREALRALEVTWIEDPTNEVDGPWRAADGGPLRRAAVRAEALPALGRALGTDPAPALARTARLAADDDDALEEWAASALARAGWRAGQRQIRVEHLAGLPVAVQRRMVRTFALGAGARAGDLRAQHLDAMCALVNDWHGQVGVDLPGLFAHRSKDGHSPVILLE